MVGLFVYKPILAKERGFLDPLKRGSFHCKELGNQSAIKN